MPYAEQPFNIEHVITFLSVLDLYKWQRSDTEINKEINKQ